MRKRRNFIPKKGAVALPIADDRNAETPNCNFEFVFPITLFTYNSHNKRIDNTTK